MRLYLLFLLSVLLAFTSCKKLNKRYKSAGPRHFDTLDNDFVPDVEHTTSLDMHPGVSIQSFRNDTAVYHRVANRHELSSADERDIFELILKGPTVLKANLYFTIKNAAGDTLYYDKGDAYHFVDYGHSDPIEIQEKHIFDKMDAFFDLSRFTSPPIRKTERFDKRYYKDEDLFHELQDKPNSRGFVYEGLDGKHSVRIAWSNEYQQIRVYYSY